MTPRVVVIGGGVSGLACACTLQAEASRRGQPVAVTLVEAQAAAGGHARTQEVDGFLIETGPNGFISRAPATLALIESLGLTGRLITADPAARRRFVVRDGRLCRVPDSPATLVTSPALSWRGKLRLLGEPWAAAAPAGEETVHGFAARRLGREAAEVLVDAAVSGISAGDSRQLSVAAQFPAMAAMEREHGGLVRAMFARRGPRQAPARLQSFDRGMGVLTAAMGERLGPHLLTARPVCGVDRVGGEWRVQLSSGGMLAADQVVLATPARVSARLLDGLDPSLAGALRDIPFSSLAVVALCYPQGLPRALEGYGYLVGREEQRATLGVLWESSIFAGRAAAGGVLLRVFLGGVRRPELAGLDESAIARIAREELTAVLGITAQPLYTHVVRWPEAIAQYTIGHLDRRVRIAERVSRHQGLHLCGTSYDGVSFNDAIASGVGAAHRVAATVHVPAHETVSLAMPMAVGGRA